MMTVWLSEEIESGKSVLEHIHRRVVQAVGEAETEEDIVRALAEARYELSAEPRGRPAGHTEECDHRGQHEPTQAESSIEEPGVG